LVTTVLVLIAWLSNLVGKPLATSVGGGLTLRGLAVAILHLSRAADTCPPPRIFEVRDWFGMDEETQLTLSRAKHAVERNGLERRDDDEGLAGRHRRGGLHDPHEGLVPTGEVWADVERGGETLVRKVLRGVHVATPVHWAPASRHPRECMRSIGWRWNGRSPSDVRLLRYALWRWGRCDFCRTPHRTRR
jgi:hypothetical protein